MCYTCIIKKKGGNANGKEQEDSEAKRPLQLNYPSDTSIICFDNGYSQVDRGLRVSRGGEKSPLPLLDFTTPA